jgi:hypothetical protein
LARCPRRLCRRLRTCEPEPDGFCAGPEPSRRPMTDEEWEKAKADMRRQLAQRLAEVRGQRQ